MAADPHIVDGNLLEKLNLTSPEDGRHERCEWKRTCCNVKSLLKRAGLLLIFHSMNVAVAVAGVVAVAFLLAGLVLSACWLVGLVVYGVLLIPFDLVHMVVRDRARWLVYLGYGVAVALCLALWVASLFNIYTRYAPYALGIGGGIGLALFYLGHGIIRALVRAEIWLANAMSSSLPGCLASGNTLQPEDSVKRFSSEPLSSVLMTCRMRTIVLFFGVSKVLVGGLSALAIFCSVVLPAISIFSGGDALVFSSSMAFHSNPAAYVAVVVSIWVAGCVGLVIVAALSTKLTWRVFGERDVDEEQTPATAAQEAGSSPYAELESATPASTASTATASSRNR